MDPHADYTEKNRLSWNAATARHNLHKGNQTAFFRDGGSTLYPEETDLLGDVRGKSLVHLQCNCGQDSLSIARHLGAKVTGVDISDEAIVFAKQLSQDAAISATFVQAEVLQWCESTEERFDVAFASYGALTWLHDLKRWARGVKRILKSGGRLVVIEFHPALMMFDENAPWQLKYDYMGGAAIEEPDGVGDYVGESGGNLSMGGTDMELPEFENPHPAVAFPWGVADKVSAVIEAGLSLRHLEEYPYSNGWKPYPDMIEGDGRRILMPEGMPKIPMMLSFVAEAA